MIFERHTFNISHHITITTNFLQLGTFSDTTVRINSSSALLQKTLSVVQQIYNEIVVEELPSGAVVFAIDANLFENDPVSLEDAKSRPDWPC